MEKITFLLKIPTEFSKSLYLKISLRCFGDFPFPEIEVFSSKVIVDIVVLTSYVARDGVFWEVTNQPRLIEYKSFTADERKHPHFDKKIDVNIRITHMEHLTTVLCIDIVAINSFVARETGS